jgi:hypothetical protein
MTPCALSRLTHIVRCGLEENFIESANFRIAKPPPNLSCIKARPFCLTCCCGKKGVIGLAFFALRAA